MFYCLQYPDVRVIANPRPNDLGNQELTIIAENRDRQCQLHSGRKARAAMTGRDFGAALPARRSRLKND